MQHDLVEGEEPLLLDRIVVAEEPVAALVGLELQHVDPGPSWLFGGRDLDIFIVGLAARSVTRCAFDRAKTVIL